MKCIICSKQNFNTHSAAVEQYRTPHTHVNILHGRIRACAINIAFSRASDVKLWIPRYTYKLLELNSKSTFLWSMDNKNVKITEKQFWVDI